MNILESENRTNNSILMMQNSLFDHLPIDVMFPQITHVGPQWV